jgi:hypothetical protein
MGGVRRSGRIKKEIDILLLGTDTSGRVFSEETTTVVLSRHGAGIVSRYKLAPDETLTLRLLGASHEAGVRLVGPMGEDTRGFTYGVAFLDAELDFWQIDFPPPAEWQTDLYCTLECSLCHSRQIVHQSEIEADVYAIAQGILRYCESCGNSTVWRRAAGDAVTRPVIRPATKPVTPAPPAPPAVIQQVDSAPSDSLYSGSPITTSSRPAWTPAEETAPVAVALPEPTPTEVLPQPATSAPWDRTTINRRRGVRTRVTYMACIRHADSGDEIVECDNISRGGLSFRSLKSYAVDALIEVATPYSPGWDSIFVPACIKHVETLPSGTLFRYGAAYTPKPPRDS